ncbi:MAG: 3-hydroxyacyl-ACP dehydratase FabZ [Nitrospirae bacterium]|nr:3-hydroxyacyl-ACP dehydratase FabZ [Nitrospirota bacterium]
MLDINEIQNLLPHRYPFLMVDRVLEIEPGKSIVALKNVSINEPFFQGHFPGRPIMPGVLMVEAMAQVGGLLVRKSVEADDNLVYFMSVEKAKFRKPVVPGDQLRFEVEALQNRGKVWKFKGVAKVDGKVVCESEFMAMTTKE